KARWSHTGRTLAVLYRVEFSGRSPLEGGQITLHERATGLLRQTIRAGNPIEVAFSPGDRRLAVLNDTGVLSVWRLGRARPLFEVVVRPGRIEDPDTFPGGVCFSPDGRYLAAACANAIRLWDETGRPVKVFRGHDATITGLSF